jgi:DNA modification methylase
MIYNEDCRHTLTYKVLSYDYVLCSPPDYDEVGLNPKKDSYSEFLETWMPKLKPENNLVSICITDRKGDGTIYSKHVDVIKTMEKYDWKIKTHKIWAKSLKINMFRLNFMNILTFSKKPCIINQNKNFKPDVFLDNSSYKYKGYGYGMSLDVCKLLIEEYTSEDQIVYDPFMGSGTTAVAAILCNRKYMGNEIQEDTFHLCNERIKECRIL